MSWKFGAGLLDNSDSFLVAISKHFVYVTSLPLPSRRWGLDGRRKKNTAIIDLIHPPEKVKPAQLQFLTRHTEKTQYPHLIWEIPLGEGVLWISRARFPTRAVWQCTSPILDSGKADRARLGHLPEMVLPTLPQQSTTSKAVPAREHQEMRLGKRCLSNPTPSSHSLCPGTPVLGLWFY